MITDFHTHVYPDKIAERTMTALLNSNDVVHAYSDGTVSGLLRSMEKSGIERSVILPVATRKGQFDTINRFAMEINRTYPQLLSFGGIHPDDEDAGAKLGYLKENGFIGIKIHPDYTGTFIDDERYVRIISECARLGLLVVTHAGVDPACDVIHCTPQKARTVMDRVFEETGAKKPFMVFAHLGGMFVHEDVMKYLVGTECYIDISCSFKEIMSFCETDDSDVVDVIKAHGADKILFATDSPWNDQKQTIEHFRALSGISSEEKELILSGNADRLLGSLR